METTAPRPFQLAGRGGGQLFILTVFQVKSSGKRLIVSNVYSEVGMIAGVLAYFCKYPGVAKPSYPLYWVFHIPHQVEYMP